MITPVRFPPAALSPGVEHVLGWTADTVVAVLFVVTGSVGSISEPETEAVFEID